MLSKNLIPKSQPSSRLNSPPLIPISHSSIDLSTAGSTAVSTPTASIPETAVPLTLANMTSMAQSLLSSGGADNFAMLKQLLDTNGGVQGLSGLSSFPGSFTGVLGDSLNLNSLLNDSSGSISDFLSLNTNLTNTINTVTPGNSLSDFSALYGDQESKTANTTPTTVSSSNVSIKQEDDNETCVTSLSEGNIKVEPTKSETVQLTTKLRQKKTKSTKSTTSSSPTSSSTTGRVTKTKRKPHHKSRRGCQTCKKRRVKCDETHPICKNCEHLGLECGYEIAAREDALIKANLENTAPPLEGGSLSMVDLTLFHHYMTETWHTISGAGIGDQPMWRDYMPKLALKHPFLMHALMAFSAAHRITIKSDESQSAETGKAMNFHRLQATIMLKELVEARHDDIKARVDLVDAIVGSTLLLIFESLANTANHGPSQTWINQVRGSATILSAVWPLMPECRFYQLIGADIRELSSPESQLALITKLMSNGGNIPVFDPSIADLYPVNPMSVYFPTLIYLDKLMSQQHYSDFILRLFSFPALMDKKMGELLCASDSTAKRILAAYGKFIIKYTVTMKDKVWFLEGLASGGVSSGDMEAFGSLGLVSLDLPQIGILDEMMPDYDFQTFDVMEYLI